MVLLSAQGMAVADIAEVTFTSADRVRDVIHDFNTDGFEALYPKYKGGRPRTCTLPERREVKKIANVEIAHTPTNSSWLNRIEAQFTALRYFTLDGTDHASHKEQGSMIRRYIISRKCRGLRTTLTHDHMSLAFGTTHFVRRPSWA
ncbi:helix-turn-helix domain-containing protein [Streptomyces diastatochromogenes]|nr:helix-turn-helix domain-containing protein [Streptomyces diastatochromogenes]MCZ0984602.1 helix-turn-helix domain-containing protein [Streptomyces diastatochromogenes]